MSNTESNETTPSKEETDNIRRMREQLDALKKENEKLEGRVRLSAFKEAGIDPDSGIGKAVYRTYEGDIDPEQIREFAKSEYEWEAPTTPPVSEAEQRMETLGAASTPEAGRTRLEEAERLEAEKQDWVTAGAMKDQELLALARKRYGAG